MKHFLDSFVGYSEGGSVNVFLYDYDKVFSAGNQVKIRINCCPLVMKLTKVSYCWNDGEKTDVKAIFNHCWFRPIVPETPNNKPILKVITEVQFKGGEKDRQEHIFQINDM